VVMQLFQGSGGVPAGNRHQRQSQLADADHRRQSPGRRAFQRDQHHRGILASARRVAVSW
jgi:hypothetical protein